MEDVTLDKSLELISAATFFAWKNTICGDPSPNQQNYMDRADNPVIGDYVLEITSEGFEKPINRIGKLISKDNHIWKIETLDGRIYTWENCRFIVIPEDLSFVELNS